MLTADNQVTQAAPPTRTRIFVDVSETLGLDVRSGIQRVVREICRRGEAVNGSFAIIPVVAIGGEIYRLSETGSKRLHSPPAHAYAPSAPYQTPMAIRLVRGLLSPFPAIARRVQRQRAARLFDKRLAEFGEGVPLLPTWGDRFVLADTYGHSTILRVGIKARRRGAALIALTYDLFPITHSNLMDTESVRSFTNTVPAGMNASDGVLTISDWCIGELRRFGVVKPIGRFYLGYDIPAVLGDDACTHGAAWPEDLWDANAPVFVMVGTIATSKGHDVALTAFERLWGEGVDCRLLMIGHPGWEVETLIRRLNQHAERGRRLFLVHGASDALVDEAFQRADAAIIGSVVEGFGLPLVEALARSLPVIASDIAIFREIAGDTVLRYQQSDPAALAAAVRTMMAERETYAARARAFSWLDWDGSRDAFALEVNRLATQAGK